jgi:hypothetical protein
VSEHHWATTPEACELLRISRSTLYRLRMAGLLRPGSDFARAGISGNGRLLWHLPSVELRLRASLLGLIASMLAVPAQNTAAIIQVGEERHHQATSLKRCVQHCGGRCQLRRPFVGRQLAQLMAHKRKG